MQLGHILSVFLSMCVVVVTGEWKCERKGHARVKKEWKITLKVLKMSGKLMALGCWFPPKFLNSGTLAAYHNFEVLGFQSPTTKRTCKVQDPSRSQTLDSANPGSRIFLGPWHKSDSHHVKHAVPKANLYFSGQ